MRVLLRVPVLLAFVVVLGCYHATVDTGLEPSLRTIDDQWADSWVYGLVPPATVETAQRCPNGVAMIETQQSFLNGLVGVLTFGIYTPMTIKVTCAARGGDDAAASDEAMLEIDQAATAEQKRDMLQRAVDLSRASDGPVFVVFDGQ
jgi:hypothetical protein